MKGMLFVSFGTSHEETRKKTIDAIEGKVRETFPIYAPYTAWTSGRIIAKVKTERGEHIDTVAEALERMVADGVDDLIVSTTCLMHGAEMAKIESAVSAWAQQHNIPTHIAEPLLETVYDRDAVAQAICDEFSFVEEDEALLLMGHGTSEEGFGATNAVYSQLQDEFRAKGRDRFFVATVEGEPTFDDALKLIEGCQAQCVYLAPLMIVAGDHAKNDLAGDDEDSWASQLKARGLQVKTVLKGLGEYAGIQQLVCDHVQDAILIREVTMRG